MKYSFPFAVLLFVLQAHGQAGTLDPFFSGDGIAFLHLQDTCTSASVVRVLPDGRMVVTGFASTPLEGGRPLVARFLTDGSIDTSFGTHGYTIVSSLGIASANDDGMELQPDGKIVASYGTPEHFLLIRYTADGALDLSFGVDGIVTTAFTGGDAWNTDVVLQPDGRIVAVGTGGSNFALVRYNTDGTLDNTFGNGGRVETHVGASVTDGSFAQAVVIADNGDILTTGYAFDGDLSVKMAVVRYTAQGALVPSFGAGGIAQFTFGDGSVTSPMDIALQGDGKIVLGGDAYDAQIHSFAVARLLPDGSLDPSFGDNGTTITQMDDVAYGRDVAIQPDGKILLTGLASSLTVLRFNAAGTLDADFGSGGIVEPGVIGQPNSVTMQTDGKIVVAGGRSDSPQTCDLVVLRFLSGVHMGINDPADAHGRMHLGPNPSAGAVAVHFLSTANAKAHATVCDTRGRTVLSLDLNCTRGANTFTLPTEALTPGVYSLQLTVDGKSMTQRFEKF